MEENQNGVLLLDKEDTTVTDQTIESPVSEQPISVERSKNKAPRHAKRVASAKRPLWLRILGWSGVGIGGVVALVVAFVLAIFYTPLAPEWRDQYILMTYQTSNPWLCTLFFSQETIDATFKANGAVDSEVDVNTDLVEPEPPEKKVEFSTSAKYPAEELYNDGDVQIVKFSGKTPKGKYTARLIQIKDPSRLMLGVTENLGRYGQTVMSMCDKNDALCGINAGGFVDIGGVGNGGTPLGTVIKDGVTTVYTNEKDHSIIGFNKDNILVIGEFTEDEIRQQGIRDGMSWRAPAKLVVNGEKVTFKGLAGGYDPRSAIGQRADGVVLLLVVDGTAKRSVDGVNFAMMADMMYEFGAVNAANLDGGTSSVMALNGQTISNNRANPAIAHRGRNIATAWLVKRIGNELDVNLGTPAPTKAPTTTGSATTGSTTSSSTTTGSTVSTTASTSATTASTTEAPTTTTQQAITTTTNE